MQSDDDGNKFTNYLKDVTTKMENVLQINKISVSNKLLPKLEQKRNSQHVSMKSQAKFAKFLNAGDEIYTKDESCIKIMK